MIRSNNKASIRPMITSMVNPDAGGNGGGSNLYALLNVNYDYASFTPVTASNTDIVSLSFIGIDSASSVRYLLGGSGSANVFYRGSDGRFRITSNSGVAATINTSLLNDGLQHYVEFRISPSSIEFWIDNAFISSTSGSYDAYTFDVIGARNNTPTSSLPVGSVFGVTLGNQASWAMASSSFTINPVDSIGSNNLIFINAPASPVEPDFIEVMP